MGKETTFRLSSDYITLGQLLKSIDLIGSGGEVREFLAHNEVTVDGVEESRRGRKLRPGDVVEVKDRVKVTLV